MLKKKLELYDLFKDWEYEKLNLKFCKYLLGVNKRSTNIAVLSELGRMPLFFITYYFVPIYHKVFS
jgi:hypothetical protein